MAGSKYAYVRNFELPDPLLPGTFLVCRLDGHSFHRFSDEHGFSKPNDERALRVMDAAAQSVMEEYKDILLSFGESDEFSFLLRKSTQLYNRRHAKILTTLTSYFTSCYVFHWPKHFPDTPLRYPPSFDGRIVQYPSAREVRDYFAWRQVDTHINNLYNTTFWALVQQGGQSTTQAHATLKGTFSKQKHEILFSRFGINYNALPEQFKKGSVLVREIVQPSAEDSDTLDPENIPPPTPASRTEAETEGEGGSSPASASLSTAGDGKEGASAPAPTLAQGDQPRAAQSLREASKKKGKGKRDKKDSSRDTMAISLVHCDIIGDAFWDARPHLLVE